MVQLYLVPKWFVNISILIELIITLVSFGISYFSFRVYRLTKEREIKFFSLGFLAVALGYLTWLVLNLIMLTDIGGDISSLRISRINFIGAVLLIAYFALFLIGWSTLNYATFKVKSFRNYTLIVGLSLLAVYSAINKASAFYLVSILLSLIMASHYYFEYFDNRNPRRLLVFSSFLLIFISRVELYLSSNSYMHYIAGHSVELVGYMILLINLIMVVKNGQEKKQVRNYS